MKNGIALALLATGARAVASQISGFRAPPASLPHERDARMSGNPWQFGQGSRNRDLDARRAASKSASDFAGQGSTRQTATPASVRTSRKCPPCESDGRRSVDLSVLAFHKRHAMGLQ
jgi:hypothetical protein